MKRIETIEEALEAEKQGLLFIDERSNLPPVEIGGLSVSILKDVIDDGYVFWKPEQIKLAKYRDQEGVEHWLEDEVAPMDWELLCTATATLEALANE